MSCATMSTRSASAWCPHEAMTVRVGLVYPPFGPSGLPSLGLALLSASLRERGHECRTHYWNLELAAQLPGANAHESLMAYLELSGRTWFPFNEWTFTPALYGTAVRGSETEDAIRRAELFGPPKLLRAADLIALAHESPRRVAEMADRLGPCDVVGIGTTFFQNVAGLALAKEIKRRWPEKIVVLGGANCDGEMGAGLMELFDFLDAVFVGEADASFPEYIDRIAAGAPVVDLAGTVIRARGELHAGPPASPTADLDALPLPDFDDYVAERERFGLTDVFPTVLPLESSRGCWWGAKSHCAFCGLNALGMAFRHKRWERFRDEVEDVVARYRPRFLFMTDNIVSMRYFDEFMDWAQQADVGVDFFYETKANLSRHHVERLARAGITAVQPGIESFDSDVLKLMRKGTSGIQNVALLKYAREYGVMPAYNVLLGTPGESEESYRRMTAELPKLAHLPPPTGAPIVEYHRFSPYHSNPEEFGLRLRPSAKYASIYPFEERAVARIAYLFERVDEGQRDLSYTEPLLREISRWRADYRDDRCLLTWRAELADIVIVDHRPAFGPRRLRLAGYAADVFRQLDAPTSLRRLVTEALAARDDPVRTLLADVFTLTDEPERDDDAPEEVLVAFTAEQFAAGPRGCLRPLVEAGVLYVEPARHDDRYLALPVREVFTRQESLWQALNV